MPNINLDDAYILDETGAQVDQVTGLYFKNENASDTEKAQARANIGAGGTNPNLLDNAYFVGGGSQLGDGVFPINQRGQTSYTGDAQTHLDRWWQQYNTDISLTSAGLRITGYWDVDQRFAQPLPSDTYTLSVDVASLNSTGAVLWFLDASHQQLGSVTITGTGVTTLTMTSDQISGAGVSLASPSGNGDITIRAMKLEKGTVSTLANDAPPNFGAELAKCQRYLFIRDYAANQVICNGVSNNLTLFLPASMRGGGNPQLTLTATPYVIGDGIISTPTSVALSGLSGNQAQIYAPTNESHANTAISLYASTATRLTISNEL